MNTSLLHFGNASIARSGRARLVAFMLMAVLLLVSAGQAMHVHGGWVAHAGPQVAACVAGQPGTGQQDAPDEAGCPLCIAMHSAAPAATFHCTGGLSLDPCRPSQTHSEKPPAAAWHFDLFGRPPPAHRSLR